MEVRRAKITDPEEWLDAAPDFSRPIVAELREWIFRTTPDLAESIKWNMLCFTGRKLVCGLSACKRHVAFAFSRGTELADRRGLFHGGEGNTNVRSVRIEAATDLDRRGLAALLLAAVELDLSGTPPLPKVKRAPWPVPDFFAAAMAERRHRASAAGFLRLSPSCQREYLVWLTSAKRAETRDRRLTETLAALASGRRWADRKLA